MTEIIDGKALAKKIRENLKKDVDELKKEGIKPKFAVILVGDDPASKIYVRNKNRACNEIGIEYEEHILDDKIRKIANRNVPLSTFVGGLPFASNGFNDNNGYYFARDTEGGIVVLDSWKRGGDRTNSNYVIMGTAGVGKSTVAKHLILNEYMTGTKLLVIDPERRIQRAYRKFRGRLAKCWKWCWRSYKSITNKRCTIR